LYRFEKMVARGIRPYPMIYGERHRGLPLGDGISARVERHGLAGKAYTIPATRFSDVPPTRKIIFPRAAPNI
jgi:hypothetical protein